MFFCHYFDRLTIFETIEAIYTYLSYNYTIIKEDYAKYGRETLKTEICFKISLSRATQKCKCRLVRGNLVLNS